LNFVGHMYTCVHFLLTIFWAGHFLEICRPLICILSSQLYLVFLNVVRNYNSLSPLIYIGFWHCLSLKLFLDNFWWYSCTLEIVISIVYCICMKLHSVICNTKRTEYFRNLDLTLVQKKHNILGYFFPLLKWVTFLRHFGK